MAGRRTVDKLTDINLVLSVVVLSVVFDQDSGMLPCVHGLWNRKCLVIPRLDKCCKNCSHMPGIKRDGISCYTKVQCCDGNCCLLT